jgi:hypothetical protein
LPEGIKQLQQQTVGYDKDGNAQKALVQGTTGENGKFTATQIGNDDHGNLVDKTTGTGQYVANVTENGVSFAQATGNSNAQFSAGVFVNGTSSTNINGHGLLEGFSFTFTNSKLEAGQTAAGFFSFNGTPEEAGRALEFAGFAQKNSRVEAGFNTYRSRGSFFTGANSGHFNLYPVIVDPLYNPPRATGNMHFGEHNPFRPFGGIAHCFVDRACL